MAQSKGSSWLLSSSFLTALSFARHGKSRWDFGETRDRRLAPARPPSEALLAAWPEMEADRETSALHWEAARRRRRAYAL